MARVRNQKAPLNGPPSTKHHLPKQNGTATNVFNASLKRHLCRCGVSVKRGEDFQRHIHDKHLPPRFFCGFPGCTRKKGFGQKHNARNHIELVHYKKNHHRCPHEVWDPNNNTVDLCDSIHKFKSSLINHLKEQHGYAPGDAERVLSSTGVDVQFSSPQGSKKKTGKQVHADGHLQAGSLTPEGVLPAMKPQATTAKTPSHGQIKDNAALKAELDIRIREAAQRWIIDLSSMYSDPTYRANPALWKVQPSQVSSPTPCPDTYFQATHVSTVPSRAGNWMPTGQYLGNGNVDVNFIDPTLSSNCYFPGSSVSSYLNPAFSPGDLLYV